jgi:PPOX class probable F420-dependent enzyme
MAYRMNDHQAREVLAAGTHTGKLATVRADGSPHVAPVWFVLDGDDLVFTTGAGTSKGKALRRDPRAALVVDFEEPPYAFVLVEGRVSISENLDELLPLSIRIAERYVAPDLAQQFGERNAVGGELLVRLHPEKITGFGDMTG